MHEASFVSKSELARKANAPASRVRRATQQGKLQPDLIIGRVHAFKMERVPELIHTLTTEVVH